MTEGNSDIVLAGSSPFALLPLLPSYDRHPVIADINVLFQDADRYTKTGFTVLTDLAKHGVITLLTCEHARQRIRTVIIEKARDPDATLAVWNRVYLPLVRFVSVPESMCAGHPQIEAIEDDEDKPFARLAIATAPSLLLTRDHHLGDAGLGNEQWADTLTLLGTLVELDIKVHGSAHAALFALSLSGALAGSAWRMATANPEVALALALGGLAVAFANRDALVRRAHAFKSRGSEAMSRVLELSQPIFEQHVAARGQLQSRLESPMVPQSIESICARRLAVKRLPSSASDLATVCEERGHQLTEADIGRFLRKHRSFHCDPGGMWALGAPGLETISAT